MINIAVMDRSPERYLVYFILLASLGSMLTIYAVAELTIDPMISMIAFVVVAVLLVIAAGILFKRMKH